MVYNLKFTYREPSKQRVTTRYGRYPNFSQAVIAANYFAIFAIIAIFLKFGNNNDEHYVSMKWQHTENESES